MSVCTIRCMRCPTPASHFAEGNSDPAFRTKPQIGADLATRCGLRGFVFRAVAADTAYRDHNGFRGEFAEAVVPFASALKPRHGTWAYGADTYTPVDATRALTWNGPEDAGDWQAVTGAFRAGRPRPGSPPTRP
jgi:SRSO17 transposase